VPLDVFKDAVKYFAIRLVLSGIDLLRLDWFFPSAAGRGVIFTLHHVRPFADRGFNPNALLEITPEFLEQAILVAKSAGLEPVRLEDLPKLLAEPGSKRKFVCFTLDDGNRDNLEYAAPIFRKHNVPYTIFICPGLTTRATTMWWETIAAVLCKVSTVQFDFGAGVETLRDKQSAFGKIARYVQTKQEDEAVAKINALAQSVGVDPRAIVENEIMPESMVKSFCSDPLLSLGAHSMTHRNLARLSPTDLNDEIAQSCKVVSAYAGKPVTSFAFPYGWKSAATEREFSAAKNAGFSVAVTTQPGVLKNSDSGALTGLKRVSLNGLYQRPRYVRALVSGIAFWLI
jgi:peptidoglycan/xylan/chitin deacetylase (PgdA/CDA1 family)